jgi:hypothetical protein
MSPARRPGRSFDYLCHRKPQQPTRSSVPPYFTALPGRYGVDEEESERVLGFWYLLQEALWAIEFLPETEVTREKGMWTLAKAVYAELVAALRTNVRWPSSPTGWTKGARIPPSSGVRREATVGVCRSGREIPSVGHSAQAHKRFCWLMVMPTKISAGCRPYLDQVQYSSSMCI